MHFLAATVYEISCSYCHYFAATVNAAGQGGKTPLHMAVSGVSKQVNEQHCLHACLFTSCFFHLVARSLESMGLRMLFRRTRWIL